MYPRAAHVIAAFEIKSVVEFLKLDWEAILESKNCGRQTFDQILRLQDFIRKILTDAPSISAQSLTRRLHEWVGNA